MKHYLRAVETIPSGETRSFMELAILAGVPGAARAAGRAVASCPLRSDVPWHRVVRADGRPKPCEREMHQWRRLRREGARPRHAESLLEWATRVNATFAGNYPTREYASREELSTLRWSAKGVEPLRDETVALSRGFRPLGAKTATPVPLPRAREGPRRGGPRPAPLEERLEAVSWTDALRALASNGVFPIPSLLAPEECDAILSESSTPARFERSIDMGARGYGVGVYHYYREPLPDPLGPLRHYLYQKLAPPEYPASLKSFWNRCRQSGQRRRSSILIGYGRGGINHLHRDVYGPVWFPYQALVMLSKRGRDFEGGEFVLEGDSRTQEIPVSEGDVVIFRSRPERHGMRMVKRGLRYGAGLVFHLAE